jgi:hypothetical protein
MLCTKSGLNTQNICVTFKFVYESFDIRVYEFAISTYQSAL